MKKYLIIIITAAVLAFTVSPVQAANAIPEAVYRGLTYLKSQQENDGGIAGFAGVTDWSVMAFVSGKMDINSVKKENGKSIMEYLLDHPPDSSSNANDWSRRILAVTAGGNNPYDFGGVNLVNGLQAYYNNSQIGLDNAVNDDVFGVLALTSAGTGSTSAMMKDAVNFITSRQRNDGGFSYSADTDTASDVDDTASSIMALKSAQDLGFDLTENISRAKSYILNHQNADGGFSYDPNPETSWDTSSNISSTSWVMMALASLTLTETDEYARAQNFILSARTADGSFPYSPAWPPGDTFNTAFALLAMSKSYWPLSIYRGEIPNGEAVTPVTFAASPAVPPTATPTVTPQDTVSTAITEENPAPAPNNLDAVSASPLPTATPLPQITLSDGNESDIENISTSAAVPQVKGSQTDKPDTKQTNSDKIPAIVFFALGITSILIHFLLKSTLVNQSAAISFKFFRKNI